MNNAFYHIPFPQLTLDNEWVLREQSLDDTSAFFEYYADPAVSKYILAKIPQSLTDAMHEIHYCRNLFYQKTGICWSIANTSDNRMIGAVGLYINNQHDRAEICYDLHKNYWRKGIMRKALQQVMEFAFKKIGLVRIEAITVKENLASMKILERCGFIYEGSLHNYRLFEGKTYDVELFASTPKLFKQHLKQNNLTEELAL